jgi:transposase
MAADGPVRASWLARRSASGTRNRPAVSRTSSAAIGDRACSSAANRACLRKRGIKAVIPVKEDQKTHRRNRGSHGGRAPAFGRGQYKGRDTAGRCFGKLKRFRAVATRYDKREFMYQRTIDLASIRIWLRDPVP